MSFARQLDALTDRVRSGRIIAKAIIDSRGSAVKAVFEAPSQGQLTLVCWYRRQLSGHREELRITGINNVTGRKFALISAPFDDGNIEQMAAELGRVAWSQQDASMADFDVANFKIKGLGDVVTKARQGICEVRTAASDIHDSAQSFLAVAGEVKKQLDAHRDDLVFEATQLGNGGEKLSDVSATPATPSAPIEGQAP